MIEPSYRDMLADVAALYYYEGKTQNEIAGALDLSRVKVYRLLKEARDQGVVEIIIHRSLARNDRLEHDLKEAFGLTDALVLDTSRMDEASVWRGIGELGAHYLERLLHDHATIAVCVGRSTYEVVRAIRPGLQVNVRVAQALGSIPFATQEVDSGALARELAAKLGGEVLYLPSPMIADTADAAVVLRRQNHVAHTLAAARESDVALVGISNLNPIQSKLVAAAGLSREQVDALKAAGAVGDIAGQVLTLEGCCHPCDLIGRIIGLDLDELRRIPTVIAVAFSAPKAEAILGALRTEAIDVLCTDDAAAHKIIRMVRPAVMKGGD